MGGGGCIKILLLSSFKNKNPWNTKIRFIKVNIFKDTNELPMNTKHCNASKGILGFQHCPTCHHRITKEIN